MGFFLSKSGMASPLSLGPLPIYIYIYIYSVICLLPLDLLNFQIFHGCKLSTSIYQNCITIDNEQN